MKRGVGVRMAAGPESEVSLHSKSNVSNMAATRATRLA